MINNLTQSFKTHLTKYKINPAICIVTQVTSFVECLKVSNLLVLYFLKFCFTLFLLWNIHTFYSYLFTRITSYQSVYVTSSFCYF